MQKCQIPLQNFHMVSTLILAIAPCFRIVVIKITPRTCMINGSTLTISQSFVLKWNFETSKGCFLRPITVFSMGGNWLLNIGFRAPTPCSFSIFLSRMDAESAPFFAISINSCAPLVSKKWNIIVQVKLCQMYLFTYQLTQNITWYCAANLLFFNMYIILKPLLWHSDWIKTIRCKITHIKHVI